MASSSAFLWLTSLSLAASVWSNPTCNRDNVFRALTDPRYTAQAIPFCSTYVSVPPITVTTTASPVVTSTVSTKTVYSAYTPPAAHVKRDAPLPSFVSQYPASRVSSACSCLVTPSTKTVTDSTIYVTATRTLPALCNPTNFKEYLSGVDKRGSEQLQQVPGTTEQDCCLICFNTPNCVIFQFRPDNPQPQGCEYYLGRTQTDPSNRIDICPLGVSIGSQLDVPAPGRYLYNYGPCQEGSPLF